jgi:4-alpha-glucanotransferase
VAAQLLFRQQWDRVHQAARQRGIRIVGDMPIFVSGGGSDVWARRDLFRGASGPDGAWRPNPVTGVPPDYFSPLGQRWGNPHYDWERHAEEGFAWWIGRIRSSLQLVDLLRVDHFRGFVAAWEIPADEQDARRGAWRAAPGAVLFQAVRQALGNLPLIAEDLGLITPDVIELRDTLGLPGMKILQFAFGDDPSHPFLPHNWTHPNWVAYTGTHDNDTARGWYHTADADSRHRYRVYCGRDGGEPGWDLIRLAWSSIASMAIAPLQDALSLDGWSRMNTPGLAEGNWSWRVVDLPDHAARRLRELGECYGRLPVAKESP